MFFLFVLFRLGLRKWSILLFPLVCTISPAYIFPSFSSDFAVAAGPFFQVVLWNVYFVNLEFLRQPVKLADSPCLKWHRNFILLLLNV
jgi:hypothetical protein